MRKLALILMMTLLAGACAPRQQTVGTPVQEPQLHRTHLVTADAARLPLRVWEAATPKAVIIGVHGFNDYSRAFDMPGAWFAEQGITFYAYDQRSFGEAPGRGLWPGHETLTADLRAAVALVRASHNGVPVFIVGTSMGGAVTLAAFEGEALPVEGIILCAPAVWGWSTLNPLYRSTLWMGAHTLPWMALTGEGLERWPSDNIDMLRALGGDPLVIKETRIDAIYGLVDLMEAAYQQSPRTPVPVLLLYGERDEIVPADPIARLSERLGDRATFITYPDGWHMLLRDNQREKVWRDIAVWIERAH